MFSIKKYFEKGFLFFLGYNRKLKEFIKRRNRFNNIKEVEKKIIIIKDKLNSK